MRGLVRSIRRLLLLAPLLGSSASVAAPEPCAAVETRAARLADIDDRFEITLADGARLRLFGVEPPGQPMAARFLPELRAWLVGRDVTVEWLASGPDRWGRRSARVFAAGPEDADAPKSVAESLLESGFARTRVEPGLVACLAALLAIENAVRPIGAGLWEDPANTPIAADRREAFAGRAGQNVIVEGRATGVGETAARLYLNFGPIRTVDFSATFSRATLRKFVATGLDPRALVGATVRLRGLLDMRFGPQMEIVHPAAIEMVAPGDVSPYNRPAGRR